MKKRTVLINFPVRLPIVSTVLYSFLMHYFNASGLAWGVFITLLSLYWILVIVLKWNEERIDLDDEKPTTLAHARFAEKLYNLIRDHIKK